MSMLELIIFVSVLMIDMVTKYMVQSNVAYHSICVIDGFFNITYAQNTGAAWSMFAGQQMLLAGIAIVAVVAFGFMLYKTDKEQLVTRLGYVLIMSGALGNLIDRLFYGYVRDFLDFIIFGYDYPIFNVADMALCIGVGLLILDIMLDRGKDEVRTDS